MLEVPTSYPFKVGVEGEIAVLTGTFNGDVTW